VVVALSSSFLSGVVEIVVLVVLTPCPPHASEGVGEGWWERRKEESATQLHHGHILVAFLLLVCSQLSLHFGTNII